MQSFRALYKTYKGLGLVVCLVGIARGAAAQPAAAPPGNEATVRAPAAPPPAAGPRPGNVVPTAVLPPAVSSNDPRPPAPSPILVRKLSLVHQAGIGGPVAYARGGVMEFGGQLAFLNGTRYTNLSVTPSIGFFLANNFELSLLTSIAYVRTPLDGTTNRTSRSTNVVVLVEPSFHLPIADHLFVFGGLGLGVAYHQHAGTGFALAPRVGFDIMVGRSAMITPAFNVDWSTNSATNAKQAEGDTGRLVAVRTLLGASVGFKVML